MSSYVLVCSDEGTKNEGVELPTEKSGNLLLSVLQSQFEGASGLKYRNPTTGGWRAVKLIDGVLHPPEKGWGGSPYIVVIASKSDSNGAGEEEGQTSTSIVYPATSPPSVGYSGDGYKRKLEDGESQRASKNPRSSSPEYLPFTTSATVPTPSRSGEDLIVLGLEWSITDSELRKYFEQYGEVILAEVKKDQESGKSRGFGFVRFAEREVQTKVYDMKHHIKGRRVELKYPKQSPSYQPSKLFVGCLPLKPEVTSDELREHFGQFGQLSDVYIPRPYRGFGFVSYVDPNVVQRVLGMQHTLRKSTLNITFADPKGGAPHKGAPHYQYHYPPTAAGYDPYQSYYAQQGYYSANTQGYAAATPPNTSAYGYGSYAQPQTSGSYSRPVPQTGPPPPPATQQQHQGERQQGYQQHYPTHPSSPAQRPAPQYGDPAQQQQSAPPYTHHHQGQQPAATQQPPPPPQTYSRPPAEGGYTISGESVGYQRGEQGQQQYHGPPAEQPPPRGGGGNQAYDPKQIWQNY